MKNNIKILYIINGLSIGGSQKVMIENINALDFGFEPEIISLLPESSADSIFSIIRLNKKVPIHFVHYNFNYDYSLLGYIKQAFDLGKARGLELLKKLEEIKPDIIHFHTSIRELPIGRIYTKANPKTQLLFTSHARSLHSGTINELKKQILFCCFRKLLKNYHTISVSSQILNEMMRYSIYDNKKENIVIKNGIKVSEFTNISGSERTVLTALYLSRIAGLKGHDLLIKAWASLKDITEKKLLIVGPDELNGEMQKMCVALKCSDSVQFTGATAEPRKYLSEANIGVFPSYVEGLPLALLEKMATGLPVVVSNIPELTSLVRDGVNGIVFESGNYSDLADKIRYIWDNKDIRKKIGHEGRNFVFENFDSARNNDQLLNFYKKIIKYNVQE